MGLEIATVIAPLLGLLGTVIGMISAFQSLEAAGLSPEIIIPVEKPKPAHKPVKKAAQQSEAKAPSAKAKSSNQPAKKQAVSKPIGPSKAQQGAAKASFGPQIARAFSKKFRVPRNVTNVSATVVIRFKNGRLSSVSLEKSSGNGKFDDAVMSVAKNARYPKAPADLASDVQYRIPVGI